MVHTCVVFGCHNKANDTVKRGFFNFPKVRVHEDQQTEDLSKLKREKWIARIGRKEFNPSIHAKVCGDHFVTGKPAKLYEQSSPDWAPSLKLTGEPTPDQKTASVTKRYNRVRDRKVAREKHVAAKALLELSTHLEYEPPTLATPFPENALCHFELAGEQISEEKPADNNINASKDCGSTVTTELLQKTTEVCQQLTTENLELKYRLSEATVSEESFRDDDKRVLCYTGLPTFLTLITLFNFVKDHIPESTRVPFTRFQKLMLVLMKLRLNANLQYLAYVFNISQSTASRTFLIVIHVLYMRLRGFVFWPERDELQMTMPMKFRKHFGLKVVVIIDCFEIFIERPSNLLARAKTWSSYKSHNTVKFLIGVTPQGSISFLSKAWGGRASDKYITEHSGLLNKLLPGDLILAERGFDIKESVGLMCAEVKIPSFTKGRAQLPALEVESTRNIAHVRIHVERVIGLVRNKYQILSDTLPIDFLNNAPGDVPAVDKIVTVCCALTNCCESVVPLN